MTTRVQEQMAVVIAAPLRSLAQISLSSSRWSEKLGYGAGRSGPMLQSRRQPPCRRSFPQSETTPLEAPRHALAHVRSPTWDVFQLSSESRRWTIPKYVGGVIFPGGDKFPLAIFHLLTTDDAMVSGNHGMTCISSITVFSRSSTFPQPRMRGI